MNAKDKNPVSEAKLLWRHDNLSLKPCYLPSVPRRR
jgi:hypothetical protein